MKIKEVPRQQLYELYIVKNLTMKEVAGIIGCDDSSVQRACQEKGIKLVYIWERDIINKKYTLEDKLKTIFGETK